MKITLVNIRNSDSMVVPLGLLYIAAVLEKADHKVQVFDPFFNQWDFLSELKDFNPDLIGLSILTSSYHLAKKLIPHWRKTCPDSKICAGGIHPTAMPKDTLLDLGLDFVVMGEGELTMLELCNRWEEKEFDLSSIKGISFLVDNELIINPYREFIDDLDILPFPAYHLLPIERYLIPPGYIRSYFLKKTLQMIPSRGCPGRCIFCASYLIFGRKIRRRAPENVIEEIKYLKRRYNIEGINFQDDIFCLDHNWVFEICRGIRNSGLDIVWGCQTKVNTVDYKLLKEMKMSGCVQVDYGIESGSDKVLKALKKGITTSQIKEAFKLSRQAGLKNYASIMIGNPQEKIEDIQKTLSLLKEVKPTYTNIVYLTPFPGSEIYQMAKENKWFNPNEEFNDNWDVRKSERPIMSINFSTDELKKIRRQLSNSVFLRNYFAFINFRNLTFILSALFYASLNIKEFWKAIKKFFKSRILDDLIDFILYEYRSRTM